MKRAQKSNTRPTHTHTQSCPSTLTSSSSLTCDEIGNVDECECADTKRDRDNIATVVTANAYTKEADLEDVDFEERKRRDGGITLPSAIALDDETMIRGGVFFSSSSFFLLCILTLHPSFNRMASAATTGCRREDEGGRQKWGGATTMMTTTTTAAGGQIR